MSGQCAAYFVDASGTASRLSHEDSLFVLGGPPDTSVMKLSLPTSAKPGTYAVCDMDYHAQQCAVLTVSKP